MSTINQDRGAAPLYGMLSTKSITNRRVVKATKGHTEGYDYITVKVASNHGAIEVTLRENADFDIGLVPWKSRLVDADDKPIMRGPRCHISKGNLRDIEDGFDEKQQMPLWEALAHQEYADSQ